MKSVLRRSQGGLTLIEVIISMLVILVVVIGVVGYMSACALNARKADARVTGGRLGLLLLEGWKGKGGFDAFQADAEFGAELDVTDLGAGGVSGLPNIASICRINAEGINYFVTLSFEDYPPSPPAISPLRLLNATVAWNMRHNATSLDADYDSLSFFKYANY